MRLPSLILAAATIAFAAATVAHSADTPPAGAGHEGVIEARQAGFKLSLASFLAIRIGITRGDDIKLMVLPASAIAGWGQAIPTMFPAGSDGPASKALPSVWTDRAGFEAAAANMAAAATRLAELSKAGDTAAATAQFEVLKTSCDDCHAKFRKPPEKK